MNKIAFVFSGYNKETIYSETAIDDCEQLKKNAFCVIDDLKNNVEGFGCNICANAFEKVSTINECMFILNVALSGALALKGVAPHGITGFSLGAIHALYFSKAISFEDTMKILEYQHKLFIHDNAALNLNMVSATDIDHSLVEILSSKYKSSYPVSYNTKNKTVVLIREKFLNDFCKDVKYSGGKIEILNKNIEYSMPFYNSKNMEPIVNLGNYKLCKPAVPTYLNAKLVKENTKSQDIINDILTQPDIFVSTVSGLLNLGVDTFIEIGGKGLLTDDIKALVPCAKVYSANDLESINYIVKEIFAHV